MSTERVGPTAVRVARPATAFFAAIVLAIGALGLARGGFTPLWSGVPRSLPGRTALAYACACFAILTGAGLVWRRTALAAAGALVAAFSLWMLAFRLPVLVTAPTAPGAWWAIGDTAVMLATSLVLALSAAAAGDDGRIAMHADRWLRVARAMFGFGLIQFGIGHFTYLARTVAMVPAWMPGHLAVAILTGSAFIAAGVAMIVGVWGRLAATLVTAQMGLFTLLVWVPVIAGHPTASDGDEFVSSWLLTAAGWVVASSYRGGRWLAVGAKVAPEAA